MASLPSEELRTIISAPSGQYTADASEAARRELDLRSLTAHQMDESTENSAVASPPREETRKIVAAPTVKDTADASGPARRELDLRSATAHPLGERSESSAAGRFQDSQRARVRSDVKTAYRVVPFVASIGMGQGSQQAAAQLEALIKSWSDEGWEYVRLENVETYVAGSAGCFGIGATPAQVVSYSMAVFKQ